MVWFDSRHRMHTYTLQLNSSQSRIYACNEVKTLKATFNFITFQACDDEYQYHYKLFGQGAGADRDMKFYAPQMVKDYINQIRRF